MIQKGNIYSLSNGVLRGNTTLISGTPRTWKVTLIVPEHVSMQQVNVAWTSAVRYTADALDKPNWEKALQRLNEYHPTWTIIRSEVVGITVDLSNEQDDQPDKA